MWVKFVAVPGLHACLILLVGLPLYYDRQVNRPAKRMTFGKWDTLHLKGSLSSRRHEKTLDLLQVDHEDHKIDMLHVWGNTAFLDSKITKGCLIILSVFAATVYVCQYTTIKGVGIVSENMKLRSHPNKAIYHTDMAICTGFKHPSTPLAWLPRCISSSSTLILGFQSFI